MFCFLLAITLCGCVSKSKARAVRNAAFIAGQNAGMVQALQSRAASVTIAGNVRNRMLVWTRDLTVATAFLQAEYQGITDPRGFVIQRNGKQFRIDAKQLLNGEDFELEPGDVLEIQQ